MAEEKKKSRDREEQVLLTTDRKLATHAKAVPKMKSPLTKPKVSLWKSKVKARHRNMATLNRYRQPKSEVPHPEIYKPKSERASLQNRLHDQLAPDIRNAKHATRRIEHYA